MLAGCLTKWITNLFHNDQQPKQTYPICREIPNPFHNDHKIVTTLTNHPVSNKNHKATQLNNQLLLFPESLKITNPNNQRINHHLLYSSSCGPESLGPGDWFWDTCRRGCSHQAPDAIRSGHELQHVWNKPVKFSNSRFWLKTENGTTEKCLHFFGEL